MLAVNIFKARGLGTLFFQDGTYVYS